MKINRIQMRMTPIESGENISISRNGISFAVPLVGEKIRPAFHGSAEGVSIGRLPGVLFASRLLKGHPEFVHDNIELSSGQYL